MKKMFDHLENSKTDQVTNLRYRVEAVYGRPARPQTQRVGAIFQEFAGLVAEFQQLASKTSLTGIQGWTDIQVRTVGSRRNRPSVRLCRPPTPAQGFTIGKQPFRGLSIFTQIKL